MKTIKKVADTFTGGNVIATSITSSSTNDEVAGAKAVYDLHNTADIIKVVLTSDDKFTPSSAWQWHTVALNSQELKYGNSFTFNSSNRYITVNTNALIQIDWTITMGLEAGITGDATTTRYYVRIVTDDSSDDVFIPPSANICMVNGRAISGFGSIVANVTAGTKLYLKVENELTQAYRLLGNRCGMTVRILQKSSGATLNSISPNTSRLMNTGELVGMGDRAEINEQVDEKVSEQVDGNDSGDKQIISRENTLESENGSGDAT